MRHSLCALLLALPTYGAAQTGDLSSFDWRDPASAAQLGTIGTPIANGSVSGQLSGQITGQITGHTLSEITVSPLSSNNTDSVGLLPPSATGFPVSLWRQSSVADLDQILGVIAPPKHAAIQGLFFNLLLAEADRPSAAMNTPQDGSFLELRIQKLIELGAIDPAFALLERAAPVPPSLVPLLFDVTLLAPNIGPACPQILGLPSDGKQDASRVFCFARKGDWLTATLVLDIAQALGTIRPQTAALLHQFLETNAQDDVAAQLPPPAQVNPLEFRLFEAIGAPLPAELLPRAFSVADLSGDNGWKAQLHAAERLAETGAIADNTFLGIYTKYPPAASGGIWDRVRSFQKLDQALQSRNVDIIGPALDQAWTHFRATNLKSQFANIFAPALLESDLKGSDRIMAAKIIMLSRHYKRAVPMLGGQDRFLAAIARSDFSGVSPHSTLEQAIFAAFTQPRVPVSTQSLLAQGKLGEAILTAIVKFEKGAEGDMQDLLESLSTFLLVGLDDIACRAAISIYLRAQH